MAISSVSFSKHPDKCLVTIVQYAADTQEVVIGKYTKVIKEVEQTINITPYLIEQLHTNPIEPFNGGVYTSEGWGVIPQIEIAGTTYTSDTLFVPAIKVPASMGKATDLPYLLYKPGSTVQYCVGRVTPGMNIPGASLTDYTTNRDGVISFVGFTEVIESRQRHLTLMRQNKVWKLRRFDGGAYSTCLKWINAYGVVDTWYFTFLRDKMLIASSERIYTNNGYERLNRQAEYQYTIESRELGKQALDALSYILVSPRVWLVDEAASNYEEIDIITEECRTYSDTELSTLQLVFCYKKRLL